MSSAATTGKYEVHNQPIEVILARVKAGGIAIPEIQRLFVWDAVKVRNLSDSLYPGGGLPLDTSSLGRARR